MRLLMVRKGDCQTGQIAGYGFERRLVLDFGVHPGDCPLI